MDRGLQFLHRQLTLFGENRQRQMPKCATGHGLRPCAERWQRWLAVDRGAPTVGARSPGPELLPDDAKIAQEVTARRGQRDRLGIDRIELGQQPFAILLHFEASLGIERRRGAKRQAVMPGAKFVATDGHALSLPL